MLFPESPCVICVLIAIPDAEETIGKCPAKLVDGSMVNIAPTNLIIYISSVSILFETVARLCSVCIGKQDPGETICIQASCCTFLLL